MQQQKNNQPIKKSVVLLYAHNLVVTPNGLITLMPFSSPPRVPSDTSVALFTKGTRWWMDQLI